MKYNQTATYWANPKPDGVGGDTFDSPVELLVRWEDKQSLFLNEKGKQVLSKAIVYPQQDLDLNGYLFLGTSTEANPVDQAGATLIRSFGKVPNIKATKFLRKVYL